MTSAEPATSVWCSFCGKESTEVSKMVAGAGVHICNKCVGMCNTILEQEASTETPTPQKPQLPPWKSMTDEQILDVIPRIAAVQTQVEQNLRKWVDELRDRSVTWERIGATLGITRQSAWERFSGER